MLTINTPAKYDVFSVIDTDTGETLASLPTTIPISSTVDGFTRAGYKVKWTWGIPNMIPCPNHSGSFDCTPFCPICAGNQEYEQEN